MRFDLNSSTQLQIMDDIGSVDKIRRIHANLAKTGPGVLYFAHMEDLARFRHDHENWPTLAILTEQLASESTEQSEICTPPTKGNAGIDYGEDVAQWWSDPGWESERYEVEAPFLRAWLERFTGPPRRNLEILDAACSTGFHAFIAAGSGYVVTACDASWNQVSRARMIAKRRSQDEPQLVGNPFFRTLRWSELSARYEGKFTAVLCLGGTLIHASQAELDFVARNFCAVLKRPGVILIDHREKKFFETPGNRWIAHPGHARDIEFDPDTLDIRFHMKNNLGEHSTIAGRLHPVDEIVQAFARAGASLVADFHDRALAPAPNGVPEWHHLTFSLAE